MRPIPGYRGYFATDDGFILSTRRKGIRRLKGYINTDGYITVTVTADDGIKRKTLVHRLIILAYKEKTAIDGAVVRHLNGKQLDNQPNNLQWGTVHDNYMDAVKHGTRANGKGIGARIPPPELVLKVRSDSKSGDSIAVVASRYGISGNSVSRILSGKRWANVI